MLSSLLCTPLNQLHSCTCKHNIVQYQPGLSGGKSFLFRLFPLLELALGPVAHCVSGELLCALTYDFHIVRHLGEDESRTFFFRFSSLHSVLS
jgi:hypothetical protein